MQFRLYEDNTLLYCGSIVDLLNFAANVLSIIDAGIICYDNDNFIHKKIHYKSW